MVAVAPLQAPAIVVGGSALALATALVSQYGFDLQPCVLCIWQRWPYVAAILLGCLSVAVRSRPTLALGLAGLAVGAVLASGGIGAFHVGVEQGWWEGTAGCGSVSATDDLATLRAQIMNAPIVRCDEVAFAFLGISMAGWNALFAAGVAALAGRAMLKGST